MLQQVGDIYESYSLAVFGGLLVQLIKKRMAPNDLIRTPSGRTQDNYKLIQNSLGSLTVAGIFLFFWTCLLQSTYTIVVTTMGFYFTEGGIYTNDTLESLFSPDPEKHSTFQSEYIKETTKIFFLVRLRLLDFCFL